ncbi:MAG: ribonuclease R [Clostridia bacterium]|nr:ribonuclease R [Clostridia bacterium]
MSYTKLEDTIIKYVSSDDYTPLLPNVLLEEIRASLPEYEDLDESVFWRAVSRLEKGYHLAFTKKGKLANPKETGIYKGTYSSSSKGNFGFVTTDDGEFFIPPHFGGGAVFSDTVAIKRIDMSSRHYGKGNEAEVISIIERGLKTVVGTLVVYHSGRARICQIEPDNERIRLRINIPEKALGQRENGDKVICKIVAYPQSDYGYATGEIIAFLGKADSLEGNYRGILHENNIVTEFRDETVSEAQKVCKEEVSPLGRVDLRNETIFTIDSHEAKDLDDAISVKETEDGYVLGVHIADVSHYVRKRSHLDKEAMERGTSVYFTDKVVPMLPKELSNGICSLNEGVDRLALSAFMTLDKSGTILSTEIKNTIVRSKVKGIYSELNDIIEKNEGSQFFPKYRHVIDDFQIMLRLYRLLKAKSESKGAMELESEEAKIVLNEKGHPVDVVKRERGESERLIEQFMLCANEGVATFLYNASIPCVYRVHDEPDREKIDAFAIFARNLGIDVSPLNARKTITPSQLSRILEDADKKGQKLIVSSILLRSLMKAKYSSVQKPHFGLNTECYCHFTSPIRRYPDLSVHRIIKALLAGEINESTVGEYERLASLSAELSTDNEIRAVHAERDIEELYKAVYMHDRIGEEFECVISSVNSFGFFARTENLCEGLVPIESLGGGFVFDKENHILSRGRTIYRLGMRVKVRVDDVNISLRQVNFRLVKGEGDSPAPKEMITRHKKAERDIGRYRHHKKAHTRKRR